MGESVWISGKEIKAMFYTELHLAPSQQWGQEPELPCWEEGEVLHCVVLGTIQVPSTICSNKPLLPLCAGAGNRAGYHHHPSAEIQRKNSRNQLTFERKNRTTLMTASNFPVPFKRPWGFQAAPRIWAQGMGHILSPQKTCFYLRALNRTIAACAKSCCALWGWLHRLHFLNHLQRQAAEELLFLAICVLVWFTKIRKKYIPELEHLWLLYHYCIF